MQSKNEGRMTRFTAPPTKFDTAPFKTLCSVLLDDEGTEQEVYIQVSDDENDPHWLSAKDLLVQVYAQELHDPTFLRDLLDMYLK